MTVVTMAFSERVERRDPVRDSQSGAADAIAADAWGWPRAVEQPRAQRLACAAADRNHAVLIALAVAHDQLAGALGELDVGSVECGGLADPKTGAQ